MTVIALNPLLAMLLAISMLFTPVAVANPQEASELPAFTISTTIEGETAGSGLVKTTSGETAAYITHENDALYITGTQAILTSNGRSVSVPTAQLMAAMGLSSLPEPTEEDINALMYIVQGLMSGVSAEAFYLIPTANGFTCRLDLDKLCADLNVAVPTTLTTYAEQLDPTVMKYTTAILGQPLTCAQLASAWTDLGLDSISTGFTMKLTVMQQNDGSVTLLGEAMRFSFIGNVGSKGLDVRLTTPDGVSYQLNTKDLAILAPLLETLPQYITPEAFSVNFTESKDSIATYTLTLDTTLLARDLNAGLAAIISENSSAVNYLLEHYQPWIALANPDFAANLTADTLAQRFRTGLITLPTIKAEAVLTDNINLRTADLDARANTLTLTGKFHYDFGVAGSLLLADNTRYDALYLGLNYAYDEYGKSIFTLSSSVPVFDAFSTLTLSIDDDHGDPSFMVTTDTNVFNLLYDSEEQYIQTKIGPASFSFREDENETFHLDASLPEFFLSLHTTDESFNLDSTYFGLDVASNDDSVSISGYAQEDSYSDRASFGLNINSDASFVNAYLHAGYGEDYDLAVAGNTILLSLEGDVYTIAPDYTREAFVVTHDAEPIATIYGNTEGEKTTLRIYEGLADDAGNPAAVIVLDFAPGAITLPDAEPVDAGAFMNLVNEFLN